MLPIVYRTCQLTTLAAIISYARVIYSLSPRLAAGQRRTGVQFEDLGVVGQKTGVFMLDIFRPLLL
jgi:hypothetical protein